MGKAVRKPRAEVPRRRVIKKQELEPEQPRQGSGRESVAVLLVMLALFLALSLYSELRFVYGHELGDIPPNLMGQLGSAVAQELIIILGWASILTVGWAMLLARTVWTSTGSTAALAATVTYRSGAALAAAAAVSTIICVLAGEAEAGLLGVRIALQLTPLVNTAGTVLLAIGVLVLAVGAATGVTAKALCGGILGILAGGARWLTDIGYAFSRATSATARLAVGTSTKAAKLGGGALKAGAGLVKGGTAAMLERRSQATAAEASSDEEIEQEEYEEEEDEEYDERFHDEYDEDDDDDLEDEEWEDELEDEEDAGTRYTRQPAAEPIISRGIGKLALKSRRAAPEEAPEPVRPKRADVDFKLPSLDLLVRSDSGGSAGPQDKDLITNSRRLEIALENFRIGGRVVEVHPGPVVTLYQFEPAAGVKVQRIINLADDLALALKVASVRVYAPVPGKGTVGIEVPNAQREMVRLRDILECPEFRDRQVPLPLALGKDTYGAPFLADLAKMPHLLIAGATGTGKSVCINSLLLSLVFKSAPCELRLIMIDPKMLELSVYEDIPHLKAPVVTNPKRARGVLWWAVEEMERRYRLMKQLGVRDLAMYNRAVVERSSRGSKQHGKKQRNVVIKLEERDVVATASPFEGLDRSSEFRVDGEAPPEELEVLPRIVIVVDELADLMLTVGREIEELLTRLAQKARASGIHLILATQRPSVNVITGLIKANFPARISFKVASKIDARTVMDTSGAEKLLGQGDMLFLSPGLGRVLRLHSPFVSDKEVHDVVEWLRAQGAPDYDAGIEKMIAKIDENERSGQPGAEGQEEYDEFYDQAVRLVVDKGQASTSMVQRAFRIGYNRAARILELMERDGIVGPADGAKPRQVLINPEGGMLG